MVQFTNKKGSEEVYLKGKAKWANRLYTPDIEYKKWSMVLYPDAASLEIIRELQSQGVKNVLKKDDDGYYCTFGRPTEKVMRGKVVAFTPPVILDKDGNPTTAPIGNGSDVTIKVEVYTHPTPRGGKAKAARLSSVRIDNEGGRVDTVRSRAAAWAAAHGNPPRIVVGKPGLDGHSNGSEMIAVAARHAGFEVIYGGIRMSIPEIVQSAVEEDASVLGLSVLSGAHLDIATLVLDELGRHGVREAIPVVLGGIVPDEDIPALERLGVRAVFTPKDYDLMAVIDRVLDVIGAPAETPATHAARA